MTCAIEDAGFEIRDCLAWLYGSGFPKSLDVSKALDRAAGAEREVIGIDPESKRRNKNSPKFDGVVMQHYAKMGDVPITAPATDAARQWAGYGTALKPAFEPCVLARAPLDGTVAANVTAHGCGALAIDAGRIGVGSDKTPAPTRRGESAPTFTSTETLGGDDTVGRWPANVLLDAQAAAMLDASASETPSRFFYTSKASRDDRDHGLLRERNGHPTVKPTDLTEYLARLILPPRRATPRRLLVPFAGSGSEMIGALRAGWDEVVGVELVYFDLARERLTGANTSHQENLFLEPNIFYGGDDE